MPYTPTAWVEGVAPGISAARLNNLETQYAEAMADARVIAIKAADETVNNSTVLQNDDELTLAVEANTLYLLNIILVTNSGATPDFKFKITLPAGATMYGRVEDPSPGVGFSPQQFTEATASVAFAGTGSAYVTFIKAGVIIAGTAGNVTLQWAQNTAEVSDTKVLTGSSFVLMKA